MVVLTPVSIRPLRPLRRLRRCLPIRRRYQTRQISSLDFSVGANRRTLLVSETRCRSNRPPRAFSEYPKLSSTPQLLLNSAPRKTNYPLYSRLAWRFPWTLDPPRAKPLLSLFAQPITSYPPTTSSPNSNRSTCFLRRRRSRCSYFSPEAVAIRNRRISRLGSARYLPVSPRFSPVAARKKLLFSTPTLPFPPWSTPIYCYYYYYYYYYH